jgi:hypothetical protein
MISIFDYFLIMHLPLKLIFFFHFVIFVLFTRRPLIMNKRMFLVLFLFYFVLILVMGKIDLALAWYCKCMCSSFCLSGRSRLLKQFN